jgi:hypothetical protein
MVSDDVVVSLASSAGLSVAEIAAAVSGLCRDEPELAIPMHRPAAGRCQALRAAETAN